MSWEKARNAAWRSFGQRYWKAIVAVEMARKALPAILVGLAVAAIAGGVWWLVSHIHLLELPAANSPGQALSNVPAWVWLLIPAGIIAAVVVVRLRNPYRIPLQYQPARVRRRLIVSLAAIGVVVVALVWRPWS